MTDGPNESSAEALQWERHAASCRDRIDELRWLAGRWRGRGESDGHPRVSEVVYRVLFDGTFLESRERVFNADGELAHEDLTVYGAASGDREGIYAHLYLPGGIMMRYRVTALNDTILCEPEGPGARISITRQGDGFRMKILFPSPQGGWVEDSCLDYVKVE